jgi:DNA-binding transcriptional regulator YiaG
MARKNPVEEEKIAVCREMKSLRLKLAISITAFARLLDMSAAVLQSRERGVVPWQPGEVADAKRKVRAHLSNVSKALVTLDA